MVFGECQIPKSFNNKTCWMLIVIDTRFLYCGFHSKLQCEFVKNCDGKRATREQNKKQQSNTRQCVYTRYGSSGTLPREKTKEVFPKTVFCVVCALCAVLWFSPPDMTWCFDHTRAWLQMAHQSFGSTLHRVSRCSSAIIAARKYQIPNAEPAIPKIKNFTSKRQSTKRIKARKQLQMIAADVDLTLEPLLNLTLTSHNNPINLRQFENVFVEFFISFLVSVVGTVGLEDVVRRISFINCVWVTMTNVCAYVQISVHMNP